MKARVFKMGRQDRCDGIDEAKARVARPRNDSRTMQKEFRRNTDGICLALALQNCTTALQRRRLLSETSKILMIPSLSGIVFMFVLCSVVSYGKPKKRSGKVQSQTSKYEEGHRTHHRAAIGTGVPPANIASGSRSCWSEIDQTRPLSCITRSQIQEAQQNAVQSGVLVCRIAAGANQQRCSWSWAWSCKPTNSSAGC